MSLKANSFRFGEYLLNAEEKLLQKGGRPVSITPKAFELLHVLIKNHGHLVEKDKLMKAVWAESFVEDGNLAYTIRLLRQVLNDDSQNPNMIETVPRRGYRFIAEVEETIGNDDRANKDLETEIVGAEQGPIKDARKIRIFLAFCSLVMVIGFVGSGFWLSGKLQPIGDESIFARPFSIEKLSNSGTVVNAVITPDGKSVFYTNTTGAKQSVWLRQLESLSNVEIIPPFDFVYSGLAVSPDGNYLYFARSARSHNGQLDIYRISIFGGAPDKIVAETQGWISISPDGRKISFVRCYYRTSEFCSLWIADSSDGKNEKMLVSRPRPFRIGDNRISPDGKSIAFAVGQSENQGNEFALYKVDIESGVEQKVTPQKFFNIKNLAWLPDGNRMIITASRIPNKNFLIWEVSLSSGEVIPLTKDSETYSKLSLDKNGHILVSTRVNPDFQIRLFQMNTPSVKKVLAVGESVTFAPNGRIIFSSAMSGNYEIWSINSDGTDQRQLTKNQSYDSRPVVSPDGNTIYFSSNRTGEVQIWRMNSDGSGQTQLTKTEGGFPLAASDDGTWLYYHHGKDRTLWLVSTDGKNEQKIIAKPNYRFAVSPNVKEAAYFERKDDAGLILTTSLTDGLPGKIFKLGNQHTNLVFLEWSTDGTKLFYIVLNDDTHKYELWMLPPNSKKTQKIADLGEQELAEGSGFALSPDGKSFAVVEGSWKHDAVLIRGLK